MCAAEAAQAQGGLHTRVIQAFIAGSLCVIRVLRSAVKNGV